MPLRRSILFLTVLSTVPLFARAPARPDCSGTWTLVAALSSPAGKSALGPSLKIGQTESTLTISRTRQLSTMTTRADGSTVPGPPVDITTETAYLFDGTEREMRDAGVSPVGRGGPQPQLIPDLTNTYRAVWTTDQLVVMTFGRATPELARRGKDTVGQLKQVSRMSFSLDADGSLVVDRVNVFDPESGGPKESAPVPMRSVYRK